MKSRHKMETAFLAHVRKRRFFRRGSRVLVAVSGGLDSMVLWRLLLAVRNELGIEIGVVHVDHQLRGRRSEQDAAFVKRQAAASAVRCFVGRVDVVRRAQRHKESVEEAARFLRYAQFDRIAQRHGFDVVCTGHHADDQSETVLARIIKGAGLKGLSGIREVRNHYVRPLLTFRRSDLESYAREKSVPHREDHTNRDERFFRNKIRRQLLPLLRKDYDPQIDRHLGHLARIASLAHRRQQIHAERLFSRLCRHQAGKIVLEIKPLGRYLFDQKQALYGLILDRLDGARRATFGDFERLDELISDSQSGRLLRIGSVECRRLTRSVVFSTGRRKSARSFCFSLPGSGSYRWPEHGFGLRIRRMRWSPGLRKTLGRSPNVEYVDAGVVKGALVVRSWLAGDRFFPLGMRHAKKLSDFFSDEKIPLTVRHAIPIVCVRENGDQPRDRLVWICGCRIDDRSKITALTTHVWRLEYTHDGIQERNSD